MSQSLPPRKPKKEAQGPESKIEQDDRDHYSLDDIMDSLRDSEREKDDQGEIVTRSDGSKARKVKRRKRRSDQPEASKKKSTKEAKAAKKKRATLIKVISVVALLIIALLAGLFTFIRFNSSQFEEQAEASAGEWSGSTIDLKGLRLLPGNISMNSADLSWEDGYFTKSLNLTKISGHASVSSFLGQKMGGLELGGSKGTLNLQTPQGGVTFIEPFPEEDFPFAFQRYFCDALNVNFGESDYLGLSKSQVSLRYLKGSGWKLHMDGGLLDLKGWLPFPVKVGLLSFAPGEVEITSLKLDRSETLDSLYNSTISVTGRIPLKPGEQATLEFDTRNFPLEGLIGMQLSRLFSGSARSIGDKSNGTPSKIVFTVGGDRVDEVFMPFNAESLLLKRFPFISDLDEIFPERGFDKLKMDENIDGVFRLLPQGMGLQDLRMRLAQLMRIEGNVLVTHEGQLSGAMRLYISRGLVNSSPIPGLRGLDGFSRIDNSGYAVVDIELGGTTELPTDTFRKVTGIDGSTGWQGGTAQPEFDDLFKELTSPDESRNQPRETQKSGVSDGADDFIFKENTGE